MMANPPLPSVWRYIRCLAGASPCDSQSDRQLLEQFVANRDEAAFAALLKRHGPLVLGVCRHVLGDVHAAEDAFQATFLVLARKAGSIRRCESLGPWLYRVAINIAKTAKTSAAQRQAHERRAAAMSQTSGPEPVLWHDWQPLLHEEINRLPEKYRAAVVLCYLEGQTNAEAAHNLGWPVGTVKGRLARARDLLRSRLVRRGLTLQAAGCATALAQNGVYAAVPGPLLDATLTAALRYAAGQALTAGIVSARTVALTEGALTTMSVTRLTVFLASLIVFLGIGTGTLIAFRGEREEPAQTPSNSAAASSKGQAVRKRPRAKSGTLVAVADPYRRPRRATGRVEPRRKADDFGEEVKGLRARVTIAQQHYAVGEPIQAKYVVKNVSKVKQTLWHSGFWPNHLILVRDAQGKKPLLTPEGRLRRRAFAPVGEWSKKIPWTLQPGVEDPTEGNYDLTTLFDLTNPGRYTVQYLYEARQGFWEGMLLSNKASFEVVAKKEKKDEGMVKSKPVRVGGVDFQAVAHGKIIAPAPGGTEAADLGLRITNHGVKPLVFSLFFTVQPILRSADGKMFGRGRRSHQAYLRINVDKGESKTFYRRARVESRKDGTLRLVAVDGVGLVWWFDGVKPGKYWLSYKYENATPTERGQPLWVGSATTQEAAFEILPRRRS
jgi:RNA polymerase sigma factor (sigma-70 family)